MPRNSDKIKKIILFALLIVAILFPIIGITVKNYTTDLLDEIKKKQTRKITLINQNKVLINKVKRLQSAARLKEYAIEELNMYNPEPETLSIIINKQFLDNAK